MFVLLQPPINTKQIIAYKQSFYLEIVLILLKCFYYIYPGISLRTLCSYQPEITTDNATQRSDCWWARDNVVEQLLHNHCFGQVFHKETGWKITSFIYAGFSSYLNIILRIMRKYWKYLFRNVFKKLHMYFTFCGNYCIIIYTYIKGVLTIK